jgi:hypothetical protein
MVKGGLEKIHAATSIRNSLRRLLCTSRVPGTIHACKFPSPKKSIWPLALKLISVFRNLL